MNENTVNVGRVPCPKCRKEMSNQYTLNQHLRTSKTCGTKRYECAICSTSFASQQRLTSHESSAKHNRLKANATTKQPTSVPTEITYTLTSAQLSELIDKAIQDKLASAKMPSQTCQPQTTVIHVHAANAVVDNSTTIDNSSTTINNNTIHNVYIENYVAKVSNLDFVSPESIGGSLEGEIKKQDFLSEDDLETAKRLLMKSSLRDPNTKRLRIYNQDSSRNRLGVISESGEKISLQANMIVDNYITGLNKHCPSRWRLHNEVTKELETEYKSADQDRQIQICSLQTRAAQFLSLPPYKKQQLSKMLCTEAIKEFTNVMRHCDLRRKTSAKSD